MPGTVREFVGRVGGIFFCIIRAHWLPHSGQHPFSDVPALMQGSMSFGGNVAKCASLNGVVGMLHTSRLLRLDELVAYVLSCSLGGVP